MGRRKNSGKKRPRGDSHPEEQQPAHAQKPLVDSEDDEEIDEDEAFNSDDERKYGALFASSKGEDEYDSSASSAEEDGDDEDDDDDGDGGQYMLNLLNNLDGSKNNEVGNKEKSSTAATTATSYLKESPFATGSNSASTTALTLDTLLADLQDTPGFGHVQRQMQSVVRGHAVTAPGPQVQTDRALRQVQYQHQSRKVSSQWQAAVQQNRRAETLDFRPTARLWATRESWVDTFVPTTPLEQELHAALQKAGQAEEKALERDEAALMLRAQQQLGEDDLGAHSVTLQEFQQRRGQLAKMRALLFYHEQKRHHVNKIKSKQYRRIRKRQRLREKEGEVANDEELAQQLREREELERMKERATLAHKNTSKWAKRILKRGKNVDADTRRALSAQVQRGQELRQKMKSTNSDNDDDSDEEDLVETAKKVLAETNDDDNSDEDANDDVKKKGLFKMKFMQRGIETQRAQARQEARQLLLELQADESDDGGFAMPDNDSENDEEDKPATKKKKTHASKKDMEQVLSNGSMVASSLQTGTAGSVTVAVSSDIHVDVSAFHRTKERVVEHGGGMSQHTVTLGSTPTETIANDSIGDKTASNKQSSNPAATKRSSKALSLKEIEESHNPWLLNNDDAENKKASTKSLATVKSTKKKKLVGFVDVDRAVDLLDGNPQAADDNDKVASCLLPTTTTLSEKKITTLTQEELVRRAFATQSEKEADEEFAKEKSSMTEAEDPLRKKKRKDSALQMSAGWGSWAGDGAPPPRPTKFPKKFQPPVKEANPQRLRVDAHRPSVILSERRVKKTADKYMLSEIPYPFTTREEYERSMAGGLGREWNVTSSFKDMTRPEILARAGKIIQPISKKAKPQRAPAKF